MTGFLQICRLLIFGEWHKMAELYRMPQRQAVLLLSRRTVSF